jgi:hypothetical protein
MGSWACTHIPRYFTFGYRCSSCVLARATTVQQSGFGLNPMELNELYNYLWNMGVFMQSDQGMDVFKPEYRPWPKLHEGDDVSRRFYERLERSKVADMAELNAFTTRVDVVRYSQELKQQLALLFGRGIVISLQRTMGHYLQVQPSLSPKPIHGLRPFN